MSNKLLKYQEKVVMNGHSKQLKAPFVIFASCESNLKELQKYNGNNTVNHTLINIKIILLEVMDLDYP